MNSPTDWKSIPLWPHQATAVKLVLEYLDAYPPARGRAALIKMPTGTGKSGVMAVLARAVPQLQNVLILAPWASIAAQLLDDVEIRFWSHLKAPYNDPSPWPRTVVELLPSTIEKHLHRKETALAIVGTIQSLGQIAREKPRVYKKLCERVQLVCFDEGHREPAQSWSEAVRQLDRPTVLFSATPYRNDHKIFDFSPDFMFSLSHRQAEGLRYIRELLVHPLPAFDDEYEFVDAMLAAYKEHFGVKPKGADAPRVIVRCETSMEVRNVQDALRSRGLAAVAMHDSFVNEPDALRFKSVVRARKAKESADAVFWVHQFKLLEGFDDSRCQMLALYGDLDSTRALVQQIGRVLRNPKRKRDQKAYLLCREDSTALKEWLSYRRWDRAFEENQAILDGAHAFKKILAVHLDEQYFENRFRRKLDLEADDLEQHVGYRRSATVREIASRAFDLDDIAHATVRAWHGEDLNVIRYLSPNSNTRMIVYVAFGNSEIFPEDYVLEYKLAYTLIRRVRNYLFFADSSGMAPPDKVLAATRPIAAERLERLFRRDVARLNEVSLLNTDLSVATIRRRRIAARDLLQTGGSLADHMQFASTVLGYVPPVNRAEPKKETVRPRNFMRRYVGLTTGRVSDEDVGDGTYEDIGKWMDKIADELDVSAADAPAVELFQRYAQQIGPPDDPSPVNILLDPDELMGVFLLRPKVEGASMESFQPEDLCYDVLDQSGIADLVRAPKEERRSRYFKLRANDREFIVYVRYEADRQRYVLTSPDLDGALVPADRQRTRAKTEATAYLNRQQSFRIITRTPEVIYAHSRFYRPRLRFSGTAGPQRVEVVDLLIGSKTLAKTTQEKGKTTVKNMGWRPDTLFGIVDGLGIGPRGHPTDLAPFFEGTDVMVCDDMATEIADFILARTKPDNSRVVFLHAKAMSKPRPLSASALAEVSAQAMKNLAFLSPHHSIDPPKLDVWGGPWVLSQKNRVFVDRRMRLPKNAKHPRGLWDRILGVIRNPAARREVWLFLGNGLSRKALNDALAHPPLDPQVVQIVYQLQSTWAAVSSMGATLRIFCSP